MILSCQNLYRLLFEIKHKIPDDKTIYVSAIKHLPLADILSDIFSNRNTKFLICKNLVETPSEYERKQIIENHHTSEIGAHKGITETFRQIRNRYVWPNLRTDVLKMIKECIPCKKCKTDRQNHDYPLIITETPSQPFEKINIDTQAHLIYVSQLLRMVQALENVF